MSLKRFLLVTLSLFALPSCGAVAYNVTILRAGAAFRRAEAARAEELAPYEYYRAQAYLEKAREEAGYSDFQPAVKYGRIAKQSSDKALALARERAGDRAVGKK